MSCGLRPVGINGKPDHNMPCCIANKLICCKTASLSPLNPPPLVKPAASLPCQVLANQRLEDSSINCFKAEVMLPIYVGQPIIIISAWSKLSRSEERRVG